MNWLKILVIAAFAALAPIHGIMGAAGALIIIDLTVGIMAARKRQEPITSSALRRTVSKIVIYELAIIAGFLLQHYMLSDELAVTKLVASAIGMVEVKSIIENLDAVNGAPLFANILSLLGSDNDKKPPPTPTPPAA